jgi:hypothetical protein
VLERLDLAGAADFLGREVVVLEDAEHPPGHARVLVRRHRLQVQRLARAGEVVELPLAHGVLDPLVGEAAQADSRSDVFQRHDT